MLQAQNPLSTMDLKFSPGVQLAHSLPFQSYKPFCCIKGKNLTHIPHQQANGLLTRPSSKYHQADHIQPHA